MKISFVGLGVMGYPMAGHCQQRNYPTTVYNRTIEKSKNWAKQYSGDYKETIAETVREADVVMFCVGNDDDIRSVCYGDDGIIGNMKAGGILVDHTTASADIARELAARCAERKVGFLDAPVSGGQSGAENGQLTVMVGGEQPVFDLALPVLNCFAKAVTLMGDHGAGQTTKMVNQICIAGLIQGLAEALNFSERSGLDTEKVLEVISKGASQSWQMENRGKTMVEGKYDYGFAVEWMRKDLGLCLTEGNRIGARLPVTALVDQFYQQIMLRGGARWDTSSLMQLLQQDNAASK
jgi:3-hydroxyisobutyrate dehydrogenase-like beta-hydroxyacid dehydrogenase